MSSVGIARHYSGGSRRFSSEDILRKMSSKYLHKNFHPHPHLGALLFVGAVLVRFAPQRRVRRPGRICMPVGAQFVSNGAGVSLLYAREPYFIAACLGLVHDLSVSVRLTQYAVVIAWLSLAMKYAAR